MLHIYEAEFEIYESGGNDSPYYVYTSKEIRNYVSSKGDDVYLREAGNGTAKFKASDLSDRSTYKLIGYNVNKE